MSANDKNVADLLKGLMALVSTMEKPAPAKVDPVYEARCKGLEKARAAKKARKVAKPEPAPVKPAKKPKKSKKPSAGEYVTVGTAKSEVTGHEVGLVYGVSKKGREWLGLQIGKRTIALDKDTYHTLSCVVRSTGDAVIRKHFAG